MCKENCNCGGNEQVEAVRRKIERMTELALDRLENCVEQNQIDVSAQISELNAKLFDGISKEELVASIVNEDDVLSFEGLLAREDVQTTIAQSEELSMNAFKRSIEIGGKLHIAEMKINNLANELMDDVIIFGVTEENKERLISFDTKVDEILSTVE